MRGCHFVSVIAIIALLAFSSCSSTSTGSNPNAALTPPGVGSVFAYYGYQLDSLNRKIDSTARYDTATVLAIGITYQGKNNVLQAHSAVSKVGFWSYESNGDIAIYQDNGSGPGQRSGWFTIPLASKGKTTFVSQDTTSNGVPSRVSNSFTYAGDELLTEAGHSFSTSKFTYETLYADGHTTYQETDWFDRSTGWMIKTDAPAQRVYQSYGGFKVDLVSYTLK